MRVSEALYGKLLGLKSYVFEGGERQQSQRQLQKIEMCLVLQSHILCHLTSTYPVAHFLYSLPEKPQLPNLSPLEFTSMKQSLGAALASVTLNI
jgi:hypothetical protein